MRTYTSDELEQMAKRQAIDIAAEFEKAYYGMPPLDADTDEEKTPVMETLPNVEVDTATPKPQDKVNHRLAGPLAYDPRFADESPKTAFCYFCDKKTVTVVVAASRQRICAPCLNDLFDIDV